jgi:hypothetical protein
LDFYVTLDALMRLEPAGSRNPTTDGEVVFRFKSIAAENDARRGEDSPFQPTSPRSPTPCQFVAYPA